MDNIIFVLISQNTSALQIYTPRRSIQSPIDILFLCIFTKYIFFLFTQMHKQSTQEFKMSIDVQQYLFYQIFSPSSLNWRSFVTYTQASGLKFLGSSATWHVVSAMTQASINSINMNSLDSETLSYW